MKKTMNAIRRTVKIIFVVFLFFLGTLFFREQELPTFLLESIVDFSDELVVSCTRMGYGFRHGLTIDNLKVYSTTRKNPIEPVFSADVVYIMPFLRRIKAIGVVINPLPDSYFDSSIEDDQGDDYDFANIKLINLPIVTLELNSLKIIGLDIERLVTQVNINERDIQFDNIMVKWPDRDFAMCLNGEALIDLSVAEFTGEIKGTVSQRNVRPLIVALDLPDVLPYVDAFTGIVGPIPIACKARADLNTANLDLDFDLHPELGCYNNVPLKGADGNLLISVRYPENPGDCINYRTVVGPFLAYDHKDGVFEGTITYVETNSNPIVELNLSTTLRYFDNLMLAGIDSDLISGYLSCTTPPEVSVNGVLSVYPEAYTNNYLYGDIFFKEGHLCAFPIYNVSADYIYKGDEIVFTNLIAASKDNGMYSGWSKIVTPNVNNPFDGGVYDLELNIKDGTLDDFEVVLNKYDLYLGDLKGVLNANVRANGSISTNVLSTVNCSGRFAVTDGYIAQVPLFMGITKAMADYVPGVSAIVNQSQSSADFEIKDGVFYTDNFYVEGSVFSIKAYGKYDIVNDDLDMIFRMQFMKNDSIIGTVMQPMFWPFSKLLMEFKLTGSINDPVSSYISVIDRVL